MLPTMSFFTGVNAIEPSTSDGEAVSSSCRDLSWVQSEEERRVPNNVVSDSAASRNSLVGMALSLLLSTGTSTKDLWMVSNQVPPVG